MADPNKSRPYRIVTRNGEKPCSGCGATKPEDAFYRRRDRAGGRSSRCKECYKAYPSASREAATTRAAKWRAENPDASRAAAERYRATNLDKERARIKAFRRANPQLNSVNCSRRRARLRGAEGNHTAADVAEILVLQTGKCAHPWCRVKLGKKYDVDHIVAIARGGKNDRRNLQILCRPCNAKKWAKDAIDVARENGLLI